MYKVGIQNNNFILFINCQVYHNLSSPNASSDDNIGHLEQIEDVLLVLVASGHVLVDRLRPIHGPIDIVFTTTAA